MKIEKSFLDLRVSCKHVKTKIIGIMQKAMMLSVIL